MLRKFILSSALLLAAAFASEAQDKPRMYINDFEVAGGVSGPLKKTELVDKYRTYRLEALLKVTLTPQASPRSYITAGMGWQQHDVSYFSLWQEKFSVPFLAFGAGVETAFSENWFGGLELRGMYHLQSARNVYFYFPHRWEAAVHLRTGWRF